VHIGNNFIAWLPRDHGKIDWPPEEQKHRKTQLGLGALSGYEETIRRKIERYEHNRTRKIKRGL
jgi:hypothetical protein